jgi:hypothetical protein
MMRHSCAGSRLYARVHGQWSIILLRTATSMGVDVVLSTDDLWMSTSSLASNVGVRFSICLSLEYLFGSSIEYHFQGWMQFSCSIQSPKCCSINICTSEKRSIKSHHVSHHDLGGLCWIYQRILDSSGSRIP